MTLRAAQLNQHKGTILVADDEPGMRLALNEVLKRSGWQVTLADSGEAALDLLRQDVPYALLLTDYRMGGMTGLELLSQARRLRPTLPAIMMTAYGTVEDAVRAMREGASDYLLKPFSFETVTEVVERVSSLPESEIPNQKSQSDPSAIGISPLSLELNPKSQIKNQKFIAESPALRQVLALAADVAESGSTVLLTGESGAGKEVVARHIHEQSGRRGPFIAINCAALPEGLLESELFGHEKGAFTGAILSRKGRFEQANGGTLLLDEISEMPLSLQAKLLRVLQEKEISPIGGTGSIRLDVRVIATTNRNLDRAITDGEFRQDLFYRLNVIALPIPPLRERREDILPLAEHFLAKYQRPSRPAQSLAGDVRRYLQLHPWPGNVRELENLMERASLLARGEEIHLVDLHLGLSGASETGLFINGGGNGDRQSQFQDGHTLRITSNPDTDAAPTLSLNFDAQVTLEEMERRLILRTLDRTGGNRTRAADLLGISVRTIRNKLHQYGIAEPVEA